MRLPAYRMLHCVAMGSKTPRRTLLNTAKMEAVRRKNGWTQQEAAARCGLKSRQRWHAIVFGDGSGRRLDNVKLDVLYRIAEGLGLDPRDLLT